MDQIHGENAAEVVIAKDTTVKYHIFPVYFYSVSDVSAKSIIFEALGSKITATSLDVFEDEGYKVGDKTVKALIAELVEIYAENTDTAIKDLKSKYDAAEKVVTTKKTAYDAAEKAVTDAGEGATDAQKAARDQAKTAYDEAVKARDDAKTAWETARDAAEKKIDEIRNIINSNPSEDMKIYGYEIVVDSSITELTTQFTFTEKRVKDKIAWKFGTIRIYAQDYYKNRQYITTECYLI